MKRSIIVLSLVLFALHSIAQSDTRPNIVILFADDMGYSDIGCYGGEIETPNLDKLATQGIRFTQFMNCSKCASSRAALLSGLYPLETGSNGAPAQMINCMTMAELLKKANYRTLMSGKWHAKENPIKRGFDRYYGCPRGGSNYFSPTSKQKFMDDGEIINPITPQNKESFYTTDVYTEKALDYLEEYKEEQEPFLLYVAYNAPHYPLQAWPKDIAKYRGKYKKGWDKIRKERFLRQKEMGIVTSEWILPGRDENVSDWNNFERKEDADLTMATYAAMVDRMDWNIGRILDKLDELGKAENTLVLFFSDNGGNAEGEMWDGKNNRNKPNTRNSQAKLGDEWANACNTPYRKYKRYMYNGGSLTPFIARWPKGIRREGEITHKPAHLVDLVPTFLQLAEMEYPVHQKWQVPEEKGLKSEWEVQPLSGKSIVPIFNGESIPDRDYFFGHFQAGRMIRKGDWKLVSDGSDGTIQHLYDYPWELYNMKEDATEINNLVSEYPEMVEEMDKVYRQWIESADKHTGITSHKWFQPRYTKEQQAAASSLAKDKRVQVLLEERKTIGLQIVKELRQLDVKMRTGLGMEKVPMSYFGLVREGRPFTAKTNILKNLYVKWDQNILKSETYCEQKGSVYHETWKIQERIRPNLPASEVE